MELSEFISDQKELQIPLERTSEIDFLEFLSEKFKNYLKLINKQETQSIQTRMPWSFIKDAQNHLTKSILECLKLYLRGKTHEAYNELNRALRDNNIKNFDEILHHEKIDNNSSFFRIRCSSENYLFKPIDFFHIPFEKRGIVKTHRYSIPGYPSLYLGETIYTCWEELSRPNLTNFQVVKFIPTRTLTILNLSPYLGQNEHKCYNYFMLWPLIAACSIKVKNPQDNFKPEYIFPQLLLQWVLNNGKIDGIKYKSTHIKDKPNGFVHNLVFPAKEIQSTGHCLQLRKDFKVSKPISSEFMRLSSGNIAGGRTIGPINYSEIVNKKIADFSILENSTPLPYSYSILGSLEIFLEKSEVYRIEH